MECEDEGLYWKVDEEDNTLTATKALPEASYFHIIPNEDVEYDDPYDFYIGWEKVTATLTVSSTGSMRRKRKSTVLEKGKDSVLRYLQVSENEDSKVRIIKVPLPNFSRCDVWCISCISELRFCYMVLRHLQQLV